MRAACLRCAATIQVFRPDLFFLDIFMPGFDGFQVAKQIRNEPGLCHRPIVFFTGIDAETFQAKVGNDGPHEFLEKGVSFDVILTTVARLLTDRFEPYKIEAARLAKIHGLG